MEAQRHLDSRLEHVVGRASVTALALGLGHGATALPVHDEGVPVHISIAHGLSCHIPDEGIGAPKARWATT